MAAASSVLCPFSLAFTHGPSPGLPGLGAEHESPAPEGGSPSSARNDKATASGSAGRRHGTHKSGIESVSGGESRPLQALPYDGLAADLVGVGD